MASQDIRSVNAEFVDGLRKSSATSIATVAGQGAQPVERYHFTPEGDFLVSSATSVGNEGDVVLRGSIGPFPYEIHLKIKLDGSTVQVTLDMDKPIDLPPYTWTFDLLGIIKDAQGNTVGASDIKPSASMAAAGFDYWCILRCGGTTILAILLKCLPSLVGGPAAFVSCVTASAGEGAAGIAACIASKCT